uniref:Uncharacterized protein n=1 Tax=Magallana gigas TaxID=29159 RepID=K1QN97_MAGGI
MKYSKECGTLARDTYGGPDPLIRVLPSRRSPQYGGSRTILCFKTLGKKSGFGEERVEPRTTTAVPIQEMLNYSRQMYGYYHVVYPNQTQVK